MVLAKMHKKEAKEKYQEYVQSQSISQEVV
jgi:hypothetical protein